MTRPEYSALSDGLSHSDLQHLPAHQRHLINWLRRQPACTLLDIAVHFCQDEDTTLLELQPLLHQGFIQKIEAEPEAFYRVKIAPKRGQALLGKFLKKKMSDDAVEN